MSRKFLYFIVFCVVIYLGGRMALQFFPEQLSRLALVPREEFVPLPPLKPNAYADPAQWIARPGMTGDNPALWTPEGLTEDADALGAQVFFIHPTSYIDNDHWNAPLDDAEANKLADRLVHAMATPLNKSPAIWVPRYRQAAFGVFLTDKPEGARALDQAYGDVALAFDQFLIEANPAAPIVLAGHSQGAFHLRRLMAEKVAGTPLAARIAAVYALGWPISLAHDLPRMGLPACTAPDQAGCVLSWMSFAEPADPAMVLATYERSTGLDGKPLKGSAFLCTNPLTGAKGGQAPASANLGTMVPDAEQNGGKLVKAMVPARCAPDGFLMVGKPPEMGPFVLPGNNFHVYDAPMFWANMRTDAAKRVKAWKPS